MSSFANRRTRSWTPRSTAARAPGRSNRASAPLQLEHRLDRRQLRGELVADHDDRLPLDVELLGDLLERVGLLGGDRVVRGPDDVAAAKEGQPLLGRGELAELAGGEGILRAALQQGLGSCG